MFCVEENCDCNENVVKNTGKHCIYYSKKARTGKYNLFFVLVFFFFWVGNKTIPVNWIPDRISRTMRVYTVMFET